MPRGASMPSRVERVRAAAAIAVTACTARWPHLPPSSIAKGMTKLLYLASFRASPRRAASPGC
eukprot:4054777-Lingulodinium_polyedra.AAC.1